MSNIIIEGKKIVTNTNEEVLNSEIGIKNGVYSIKKNLISTFSADIYTYDDYSVLFSNEVMFNEMYLVVVLFNDETQTGWKLLSINDHLDVEIQRLTDINFLVIGNNKNTEDLGQVSFCQTQSSGKVNEIIVSFSELTQYEVVNKKYVLLSFIEEVDEHDGKKSFIHTAAIYKPDGKIEKTLLDERADSKQNYQFVYQDDVVILFLEQDGRRTEIDSYVIDSSGNALGNNGSEEIDNPVKKSDISQLEKPNEDYKKNIEHENDNQLEIDSADNENSKEKVEISDIKALLNKMTNK